MQIERSILFLLLWTTSACPEWCTNDIYSIRFKINTILEPDTLNIENSESEFWRIHATLHQTISVINLLNGPVVFSGKGTYRVVC